MGPLSQWPNIKLLKEHLDPVQQERAFTIELNIQGYSIYPGILQLSTIPTSCRISDRPSVVIYIKPDTMDNVLSQSH